MGTKSVTFEKSKGLSLDSKPQRSQPIVFSNERWKVADPCSSFDECRITIHRSTVYCEVPVFRMQMIDDGPCPTHTLSLM